MYVFKQKLTITRQYHLFSNLPSLVLSMLLLALPVLAQAVVPPGPIPDGSEFRVNQETYHHQYKPEVDYAPDGSFVVAWEDYSHDGSRWGIFARCYDADGTAKTNEFTVNTHTNNDQRGAIVKVAPDGSFVVSWHSNGPDGSGWGVFMRRYNSDCQATGNETQVNTYTSNTQSEPNISFALDGHFVITWHSNNQDGSAYGIYAQLFNADGSKRGSEFRVNTSIIGHQQHPEVAMDAEGGFTIVWQDDRHDGNGWGVFAQRYNVDGNPVGGEFQVNTMTASHQYGPSIAMTPDGRSVITWHSNNQDGSSWGIYAQRYDADGTPASSEFRVNTYTSSEQAWPSVSMSPDGRFVIAHNSLGQDGSSYGMYAQSYAADGTLVGGEFLVNSYTSNQQRYASVSMGSDGRIIVAWTSYTQDTSNWGVYAQRYFGTGGSVDLGLTVTSSPAIAAPGGPLSYTFDASNAGPDTAWYSVLSATLPTGFGYDSFSGNDWTCGSSGQELTCVSLELTNGDVSSVTLNLTTAANSGELNEWPTIDFDFQPSLLTDTDPGNNQQTPAATEVDVDNDGIANSLDDDIDGDGVSNDDDLFPYDVTEQTDFDGDGIGDNADPDDDGDFVDDVADAFPFDASESLDTDGDGIGNNADTDDDGDGRDDRSDACPLDPKGIFDTDGDGICNYADPDDDNNGVLDVDEPPFVGPARTSGSSSSVLGSFDLTLLLSLLSLLSARSLRRRV